MSSKLAPLAAGLFAALTMSAMAGEYDPNLTAYYTFDDLEHPLAATVGPAAAVVNYSKSGGVSEVSGLGNCSICEDPAVTAGLDAGSHALSIPIGQALRIAHGVPTDSIAPWCISMRFYLPTIDTNNKIYFSMFATGQQAQDDAALCIYQPQNRQGNDMIGGGDVGSAWGYYGLDRDAWHVVTVTASDQKICLYLDGVLKTTATCGLAKMRNGRLNLTSRPFLFVSGDESGEDNLLHFDYVKVYNTDEPDELFHHESIAGMTACYTFDDETDPLVGTIGPKAAVVNFSKSGGISVVEGLGNCTWATETEITSGLEPGSRALWIPKGQAVRIEHGVSIDDTVPWAIAMRIYLPENTDGATVYNSLFDVFQNADGDATICIRKVDGAPYQLGGSAGDDHWAWANIAKKAWHTIAIAGDMETLRVYLDGLQVIKKSWPLETFHGGRMTLKNRPYIFVSGDENGEDAALCFDWVKVYETPYPDALIAKTAVWSGDAAGDPTVAENWTITSTADGSTVGGLPDGATEVVVGGSVPPSIPVGTEFDCARIRLEDGAQLVGNADWRGLGLTPWYGEGALDLNGFVLRIASLRDYGEDDLTFTSSNAGGEAPGELHIDVAPDTTETNSRFTLTGNLALFKDGAGDYIVSSCPNEYVGGTVVAGGRFRFGVSPASLGVGAKGSRITVNTGAVLDPWGQKELDDYVLCLNGGMLKSTHHPLGGASDLTIGSLELLANSRIEYEDYDVTRKISHDIKVAHGSVWDLGGHTLDIVFTGYDPDFYTTDDVSAADAVLTVRNGTIRTSGPGWFHDYGIDGHEGGNLDLDNYLRLQLESLPSKISQIRDFTVRPGYSEQRALQTSGKLCVWGTFTPLSSACVQVELQNGSAIDVSTLAEAWSIVYPKGDIMPRDITTAFADNATITVKVGERTFDAWTKVIAWTVAPSNLSTLKFVPESGQSDALSTRVRADGVYAHARKGLIIVVQ